MLTVATDVLDADGMFSGAIPRSHGDGKSECRCLTQRIQRKPPLWISRIVVLEFQLGFRDELEPERIEWVCDSEPYCFEIRLLETPQLDEPDVAFVSLSACSKV